MAALSAEWEDLVVVEQAMGSKEIEKLAVAAAQMLDKFEWLDGELCIRVFASEMSGYEMLPVDEDTEDAFLKLQEAARGDELCCEEEE